VHDDGSVDELTQGAGEERRRKDDRIVDGGP